MQILAAEIAPAQRLVLGRCVGANNAVAVAEGNRLFQRHLAVLGSTGAGESRAVALMLERAARLPHANLIVFDLHGEYTPLTQSVNGREPVARRLRFAGPGDLERASDNLLYLPYWLLKRDELMTLVLNDNDPDGPDQLLRFTEHVQTLKQISLTETGEEDSVTRFNVDSPIPYRLDNLIRMLDKDNTEKVPQHPSNRVEPGPYYGRMIRRDRQGGRKYGVGLVLVSQRPSDVSRTILSQCNNFIVMRIANDHDQAMVERLAPETVAGVKGGLPVLDVGEAVVIGDALMLTSRVKFDAPRAKPTSATQRYWSMWSEQPSSRHAINAGVEALRNQLAAASY